MTKPIVIITGADTPTGLTTVRSLGNHPVDCWGVAENPGAPSCRSRYWARVYALSVDPVEQVRCVKELGQMARRLSGHKPLILFSQDDWVLRASADLESFSECFRILLPEHENLLSLMDKTLFHGWAEKRDYPLPRSLIISSSEELRNSIDEVEPPFIIKPLVRTSRWDAAYANTKCITCYDYEQSSKLLGIACELFDLSPRYLLQEWIAGEDADIVFCLLCADEAGRILDICTGRKYWQWPPLTGSTAICTDFYCPEIADISRRLMLDAGLRGLGSVEFKFCRNSGRYLITEPTIGRNDYQSFLAVCAGHNLTGRLVESVFDISCKQEKKQRSALWMDELAAFERARVEKRGFLKLIGCMARYLTKKKCFLFADFRDLKPAFARFRELL